MADDISADAFAITVNISLGIKSIMPLTITFENTFPVTVMARIMEFNTTMEARM